MDAVVAYCLLPTGTLHLSSMPFCAVNTLLSQNLKTAANIVDNFRFDYRGREVRLHAPAK